MKSVNQVILLGRLGQDPEQSRTKTGKERTAFSLATSHSVRVDDGWNERTDWHKVVAFDWLARSASQHLRKGDPVVVVGRLSSHKWTDDQGNPRTSWNVVARELSFPAQSKSREQRTPENEALPSGPAALPGPMKKEVPAVQGGIPF